MAVAKEDIYPKKILEYMEGYMVSKVTDVFLLPVCKMYFSKHQTCSGQEIRNLFIYFEYAVFKQLSILRDLHGEVLSFLYVCIISIRSKSLLQYVYFCLDSVCSM